MTREKTAISLFTLLALSSIPSAKLFQSDTEAENQLIKHLYTIFIFLVLYVGLRLILCIPRSKILMVLYMSRYLPKSMPCPGGDRAWNETDSNETLCSLQKNPCEYLNSK